MSRRALLRVGLGATGTLGLGALGSALVPGLVRAQASSGVTMTDLGGVFLLQASGCNVLALPGGDGALMIDGGLEANAASLLDAVHAATGNERIAMLINTHWHPEQTGANALVGRAGGTIFAHEKTALFLSQPVRTGLLQSLGEPLPAVARPTEITRGDGSIEFGGMRLDYGYLPQAHTDGDLYVHVPERDILAAGGVVSGEQWPLLDYLNGAWYGGLVRALQWLAELVGPETRVVPAEGRVITGRDVMRQRQIHDALFETMIGYMNKGFGAEDAVASRPLAAYEAEFGDASAFLDGAYRSMLIAYVPE